MISSDWRSQIFEKKNSRLTFSGDKTHEKVFWTHIRAKQAKIRPEIRFFAILSNLILYFSMKLYTVIACNNV